MKVSDVMQRSVVKVAPSNPLKDVARLIFSLGVSSIPVVNDNKLVGIVTEDDIFRKIRPSLLKTQNKTNGNALKHLLETPVEKIMNKNVQSIAADAPTMKAQTIMFLNQFTTLPVVNDKKELLGIISEQDVFKELIKKSVPRD